MGTKKIDKLLNWLEVIHILEDLDEKGCRDAIKKTKELNKIFYIKKRKTKDDL